MWVPAKGHSGGLIMGINCDLLEIEESAQNDHFMGIQVRNRCSNFRFWVVDVYGPAQHDLSGTFITELSDFCAAVSVPMILGGDFNLIRDDKDRNVGHGDPKLMDLFNDFIGNFQLREIHMGGAKYTWSNKQQDPILVKLDRILVSIEWEANYPRCFA